MTRWLFAGALVLAACAALVTAPKGAAAATCTATQKQRAQQLAAAYAGAMPRARAAYFRKHRRASDRAAFVKGQKAALARLRAAAACTPEGTPIPTPTPTAACSPSLSSGGAAQPNEGTTQAGAYFRSTGVVRAVALYVDFPDAPSDETVQQVYDWTMPQALAWFPEVSYGRLTLQVARTTAWIRMTKPSTEYRDGPSATLFADAIAAADATTDFSGVDLVLLAVSHGSHISATHSFMTVRADGTMLQYGVVVGDHNRAPTLASVMTSDIARLMGLPDLTDATHPTDPATGAGFDDFIGLVGRWSIMSDPHQHNHVLGWEKWKLGWLDAAQIRCLDAAGSSEYALTPTETPGGLKLVVVRTSASTAYAVELRRSLGMDSLNCDEGVLVYTVDASAESGHHAIEVVPVAPGSQCGPRSNAVLHPGATYEDAKVKVELLTSDGTNYTVRVTRK